MTKLAVLLTLLALLLLAYVATAQAQGCGCEMPPELGAEPHLSVVRLPLVAAGRGAWLGDPPLPDKPVRPPTGENPVYLPLVGAL